jgi:N-acetylglutamate synthase-like GNAT family acetyltransferase
VSGSSRHPGGFTRTSEIRTVCTADLDAAIALADGYFGPIGGRSLTYCRRAAPELTLCCEAAGEIVGVCSGYRSLTQEATAILECLAVEAVHVGQGVGTRLLNQFENVAREVDLASVQLAAEEGAPSHFYLRRGYQILAAAPAHASGHIVLSKSLLLAT